MQQVTLKINGVNKIK